MLLNDLAIWCMKYVAADLRPLASHLIIAATCTTSTLLVPAGNRYEDKRGIPNELL